MTTKTDEKNLRTGRTIPVDLWEEWGEALKANELTAKQGATRLLRPPDGVGSGPDRESREAWVDYLIEQATEGMHVLIGSRERGYLDQPGTDRAELSVFVPERHYEALREAAERMSMPLRYVFRYLMARGMGRMTEILRSPAQAPPES